MNTRKLLLALATAAVAVACFGAAVFPASAQPRTFQITLVTGQTMVVTVDVPPGTPVDAISFPGVNGPIASVTEITPTPPPSGGGGGGAAPAPAPAAPAPPTTPTNPAAPPQ